MLGYTFPGSLSQEQLALRRWLLDEYADQAQFSAVIALICLSVPRWLPSVRQKLGLKREENSVLYSRQTPIVERYRLAWRQIQWECGNRCRVAGHDLGTFGEVIGSVTWLLWLLHLCTANTGGDYLHLTKRFGVVGASQIPLQLLMAMKPSWSPVQLITRKGHEELKAWHQNLGRIIQLLLSLHAVFYLNFYVQMGLLSKRIKDSDVQIGLVGITILTALGILASTKVRAWNYRIFFASHIYLAMAFLPLMYFHVKQIQTYMLESIAIQLIHLASSKYYTSKLVAAVKIQQKSGLIKLDVVPARKTKWIPGQHVYLKLASPPTSLGRNPFTVASLPNTDGQLTLAMRVLNGNTKKLAQIVSQKQSLHPPNSEQVDIELEGPYGASRHLPDLSKYQNVLLVAGGVGASYTIPVFRSLLQRKKSSSSNHAEIPSIHMIWTVRSLSETNWAFPIPELEGLQDDTRLDIYVSGAESQAEIDRYELNPHLDNEEKKSQVRTNHAIDIWTSRPHFETILGDYVETLDRTDMVAVLVCGPPGMSEDLRKEVGGFVERGQDVFWHAEEFGFGP